MIIESYGIANPGIEGSIANPGIAGGTANPGIADGTANPDIADGTAYPGIAGSTANPGIPDCDDIGNPGAADGAGFATNPYTGFSNFLLTGTRGTGLPACAFFICRAINHGLKNVVGQ